MNPAPEAAQSAGQRRSFRANLVINSAFPVVPILVSIGAVPLYLTLIGIERYGILSFVWLVSGMFALFDLGLGQATNYRVAQPSNGTDASTGRAIGDVVLTALAFNTGLGVLAGIIFWLGIGPLVFQSIKTSPALLAEVDRALPLIAALLPASLALSVLRGAAEGRSAFVAVNAIQTVGQLVATLGTLAVAWIVGAQLTGIILTILVVRLATVVALSVMWARVVLGARLLGRRELFAMLRFGGWNSLYASVSVLLGSADRFGIGWVLGATATTYYVVPYSVVQRAQFVREALLRTLFPKLSSTTDPARRRALAIRMLIATLGATGIVSMPFVLLARPILTVWIDADFAARAAPAAIVLMLAFWLVTALRTLFVLAVASERPDLPARLRMVTAVPFLAVLTALVEAFGVEGAAIALLLWWAGEFAFLLWRMEMVGDTGRPLAAWAALWAIALVLSLLALPVAADVGLALIAGLASTALALAQSADLRDLRRWGLARLRRPLQRATRPDATKASRHRPQPAMPPTPPSSPR